PGQALQPARAGATGTVTGGARAESGSWLLRFSPDADTEALGEPPLPPYIRRGLGDDPTPDRERYQTVYARVPGSVAAPTAGLHFDAAGLAALAARGIEVARIALHVGPGTFRPLTTDSLEEHAMHAESYAIPAEEAARIAGAARAGRRIVAVGTTSVRTLETEAERLKDSASAGVPLSGTTSLFITPGFRFVLTGALLTNFPLPR
ncbi:MAG: S-adenosylmethionine:tRNA ribosyltransferase-isomerase, partial [bacterium]